METVVEFVDNGVPEDTYRCYFVAEQDGDKVENRFQVGDQAYSKKFNVKTGESSQVASNYYWRLVTGVGDDYIDLSISDCDTGSDVPQAEDVICHLGSRTNNDRRNALEFSAVDDFSPSVTLYQGIGESDPSNGLYPYSFANKAVVQYGVNRLSNRAFMDVYGDMYIGDRDENSFLRFDSVGGLTIKGNLSAGTTLGNTDLTLEQRIALINAGYNKEEIAAFENEPQPAAPQPEPDPQPAAPQPEPQPAQNNVLTLDDIMKKLQQVQEANAQLTAAVQANAIAGTSIPGGGPNPPDAASVLASIIRPPRKENK